MDKVLRYFEVKPLEGDPKFGPRECFIMHSFIDADFGPVHIKTTAEVTGFLICQRVVESSGMSEEDLFLSRVGELNYFCSLLPMFNPKNKQDYGLSQTQPEPSLPPEF